MIRGREEDKKQDTDDDKLTYVIHEATTSEEDILVSKLFVVSY